MIFLLPQYCSRISAQGEQNFSAVQTTWRRERDSNPRYGFPYSGFQDHPFQPLTHPSAGGNINNLCVFASLHGLFIRGLYMLLSPNPQPSPGTLVESLLIQPSEDAGMELHDLGEMGEKVRQAVIAEVKVVLVLHAFFA